MQGLNTEGTCKKCGKHRIIVNKRHGLCQECNYLRLHGHKSGKTPVKHNRFNQKFAYCTQWGFTTEKDMFAHIWDTRKHVSQISGKPMMSAGPENFAHVLAKGINKYPHLRFCPWNIYLITFKEHHLWDNGSEEQRAEYALQIGNVNCWTGLEQQAKYLKEYYTTKFWEK